LFEPVVTRAELQFGVRHLGNKHLRQAEPDDNGESIGKPMQGARVSISYGLALCRLNRWDQGIPEIRDILRVFRQTGAAVNRSEKYGLSAALSAG
jgi:hypothetical protein